MRALIAGVVGYPCPSLNQAPGASSRGVIALRYYEDLTEAGTADVLGVAIGTVKSTTARALTGDARRARAEHSMNSFAMIGDGST